MKRPTEAELQEYAAAIDFHSFDAQAFLDYYDMKGWMIGKNAMVNWNAAVRTWKTKAKQRGELPKPLPIFIRNKRINDLNKRKVDLMRMLQTAEVKRELAYIQAQLFKL